MSFPVQPTTPLPFDLFISHFSLRKRHIRHPTDMAMSPSLCTGHGSVFADTFSTGAVRAVTHKLQHEVTWCPVSNYDRPDPVLEAFCLQHPSNLGQPQHVRMHGAACLYTQTATPHDHLQCLYRSSSCQLCITSKPSATPQHQLAACCLSPSWSAWPTSQKQLCCCCSSFSKPAQMCPHAAELSNAMLRCACSMAAPAHQMLCWRCSLLLT